MPATGRIVSGTCGSLIGRGQPERLGPRCGGRVPALCRRFAGPPGGGLPPGRGLVAAGLRGGVPVLIVIVVTARAVRPCRGMTAVLARPSPAGSRLRASGFAVTRDPPGRLAARGLMAAPLPVTPVTCGGLISGWLVAPWTPGVSRRVLAAPTVGHGGTLGRYRAWPPGGVRTRTRCRLPGLFGEIAVLLAIVVPAAMARSRPVIGCLPRTGGPPRAGRTGRCGPEPVLPDPRRSGRGAVSGCPGGPSVPRCCSTEKLSAPEQNSGAESERREDAHGDRSVDQSQAGREHPGHEHRHRRNGQKGTGADHVRPPATRRGAPGCWLPAVVRRTVRGVEAPVVPSGLG